MGRVSLPVTFSTEENFRIKYLSFEIAAFKLSYHAILGRPMLARFMAIPHYTYLVLKMRLPRESSQFIASFSSRSSAIASP
jgi:hypothetical protein